MTYLTLQKKQHFLTAIVHCKQFKLAQNFDFIL